MTLAAQDFQRLGEAALHYVREGMIVGLGTGRAAHAFLEAFASRVKAGLRAQGIPTSEATRSHALRLGIALTSFEDADHVDVVVDGADEVDPRLNLIKGHGGALLREKVVASAATQVVILVGHEKLVERLGSHKAVPVEVIPFGAALVRRRLEGMGGRVALRRTDTGEPFVTDNGHYLLDCSVEGREAGPFDAQLRAIPGVVETGFFLQMAHHVIVQYPDRLVTLHQGEKP